MIADIKYGVFFFFGTAVICGMTFAYFFLPETKGVQLEDMDILFESKGFARQKRKNLDAVLAERREDVVTQRAAVEEKNAAVREERVESV
jgi:hypothetical protein